MYISRFKIANYKSYRAPSAVEFTPGVNVVVGQNSAGKTALLEAIANVPLQKPHRSPRTVPFDGARPSDVSTAEFSFSVGQQELREIIVASRLTLLVPYAVYGPNVAAPIQSCDDSEASRRRLVDWFLSQESYTFELTRVCDERQENWVRARQPSFGFYEGQKRYANFSIGSDGNVVLGGVSAGEGEIGLQLVESFKSRVYVFRAERLNVGECEIGNSPDLYSDAANLPAVLNILQNNPARFRLFSEAVRSVLPQVPQISVRPTRSDPRRVEIRVWPFFDSHPLREDLIVRLDDCGTGVGQVLAILYVVLTSRHPRVILIDEPQSFLHPGAIRKLIDILKMHPEHQYIIATHSPAIISAADCRTVTVARLESGEGVLEQVNVADSKAQEALLAELGARLSDVFGSDNVVWVEGLTEENCYKVVFRDLVKRSLMGTQILGVRRTGDLEGDLAERVIEIYNKISSSGGLIPPALAFFFDRECRSEQRMRELIHKSNKLLHFLPRRMYENYLLNPQAIAAVANSIEGFSPNEISRPAVESALATALENADYYCDGKVPGATEARIYGVHAKRVLNEVFGTLSQHRVRYEEVEHGRLITEWLIGNSPGELSEIRDLLNSLIPAQAGASEMGP